MNNKDGVMAKLADFAEDKGFYIILMLCVIAIGISGYVLFFVPQQTGDEGLGNVLDPGLPSAGELVPDHIPVIPDVDVRLEPEEKPVETPVVAPEKDEEQEVWLFSKSPEYFMPLSGEVIREFSVDTLIYDKTMDDWRTHNGVDISCAVGDEVKAIAAGTVESVIDDKLQGNVIIISHDGGLKSIYCGLAPNTTMAEGMAVEQGQVIGTAGNTMKTESLLEPHLHLAVMKDGDYIDPLSLKLK